MANVTDIYSIGTENGCRSASGLFTAIQIAGAAPAKSDTMRWELSYCQRIHVTLMPDMKGAFGMNQNRMETSDLVDIRTVTVDKSLPKEERIADFVRQIKNPYRFRCGDFVVNATFARNGATLEDCLRGILR